MDAPSVSSWALYVALIGSLVLIATKKNGVVVQGEAGGLTTLQKVCVWIVCIANPIISGLILYYGWRKKFPAKAKQANKISFIVFGIELLLIIIYVVWLSPK